MGAKIASFLATLILSIPLAAIGLMAVFGIPQLVPANGDQSSTKNNVIRNVQDAFNWGDRSGTKPADTHEHFDDAPEFGADSHQHDHAREVSTPFSSSSRDQYASNASSSSAFDSSPRQNFADNSQQNRSRLQASNEQQPRHWSEIPSMSGDQSTRSTALSDAAGFGTQPNSSLAHENPQNASGSEFNSAPIRQQQLLTWRQASARLNELGVKDYHLERGAAEGTFLFVCIFSPGDAPHVVHRFESEADDPLMAVNQALQQVDKWMRTRYASANFPTKPQSISLAPGAQQR